MSKTPPQVLVSVEADGTLPVPRGQDVKFYQKVREMRRDPTVRLARALSVAPILASQWSVESEAHAPEGASKFIADIFIPMRMHIIRTACLGMSDYGWQAYEKVCEITPDYKYTLKYLKPLLQDMTDILVDPITGDYVGLHQTPMHTDEVFLNKDETFIIAQEVEGTNWYGESTMRSVEKPYDADLDVEKAASRFDRKMAGSHWVVYYPYGTSIFNGVETDNATIARALLASLEASGGIAVPRTIQEHIDSLSAQTADLLQWKIELMTNTGGVSAFMERFNRLDKLKVRAFAIPERALLEGQFGTKAESEAHQDFAITNMDLKHKDLVQQLNEQVVDWLLRMNYGESAKGTVYLQPAPITDTAKQFLNRLYDKLLADPNVMSLELAAIDLEQIRDRLGVPTSPQPDMPSFVSEVEEPVYEEPVYEEPVYEETISAAFDPNQPRDDDGKWGSGGSGGASLMKSMKPIAGRNFIPKRRKVNIDDAARVAEARGYKLEMGDTTLVAGKFVTTYKIMQGGKTHVIEASKLKQWVQSEPASAPNLEDIAVK